MIRIHNGLQSAVSYYPHKFHPENACHPSTHAYQTHGSGPSRCVGTVAAPQIDTGTISGKHPNRCQTSTLEVNPAPGTLLCRPRNSNVYTILEILLCPRLYVCVCGRGTRTLAKVLPNLEIIEGRALPLGHGAIESVRSTSGMMSE